MVSMQRARAWWSGLGVALLLATGACEDGEEGGGRDAALPGETDAGTTRRDAAVPDDDEQDAGEVVAEPDAAAADGGEPEPDAAEPADAGAQPDAGDDHEHEEEGTFERLLVADALSPRVHVLDVEPDAIHQSMELAGVARVYTGSTGLFGYAVQGDADRVSVIASGLSILDHGDHVHEERADAELLPYTAEGDYPVHFVAHDGYAVLFFDNDGTAHVIEEESLTGAQPMVTRVSSPMPHHGVALTFHDHVLITRPELLNGATRATPTGIAVHALDGTATGQAFGGCTSLHGEATSDHHALFGCAEGVLVVSHGASGFSGRVLPNPASTVTPAPRVGTLAAGHGLTHFIGNYGADALCTIDPVVGAITPVSLGERYVQFDVTPDGEHVVVLTRAGELVLRDPTTLAEQARFEVTSAVTDDSNHGALYPQFAFGEHYLYVTDPGRAEVRVVDLHDEAVVRTIGLPDMPAKITVLRPAAGH
jgi:zinc transport system substrate-binding protein